MGHTWHYEVTVPHCATYSLPSDYVMQSSSTFLLGLYLGPLDLQKNYFKFFVPHFVLVTFVYFVFGKFSFDIVIILGLYMQML